MCCLWKSKYVRVCCLLVKMGENEFLGNEYIEAILVMRSALNVRDKIKVADVVLSTNHVTFLTNRFPRLISLPTSTIFVLGTGGITAILK